MKTAGFGFLALAAVVIFGAVAASSSARSQLSPAQEKAKEKVGTNPGHIYQGKLVADGKNQLAIVAGGCFWGLEDRMRELPGVVGTAVGYSGGHVAKPTYKQVCMGDTGHAEAVLVEFDPSKITYSQILEKFWEVHNPTTLNRQGPDVGSQYRSAIYFLSDRQKEEAVAAIKKAQPGFNSKIVTEVTAAKPFYVAEDYHQQYHFKTGTSACPIDFSGKKKG